MKENISETNRHEFKISRNNDVRIQARLNGYVGDRKVVSKSELKTVQKLYLTPPPIFINVYFDFDKFNIRPGADDTLNQVATILEEHPELVVEVRGHTDSRGTNAYNDVLAVNRSNSAIKYLLDKGISQDRMIPKGFGENEPVAPNEDTNGNDDPAGRQMNRRVEFKIIKAATDDAETSDIKIEVEEKKK
jgi:outer membrane protein OmpA-like peptidoglycan-associated protein